jgi:hypothetical protein
MTTSNNYWSSWDTPDGVYQFDNDYSCEQDCRSTTNEFNVVGGYNSTIVKI